jgi:hypothetical protein
MQMASSGGIADTWNKSKGYVARHSGKFIIAMAVVVLLLLVFVIWKAVDKKEGYMNESPYLSGMLNHTNWQSGGNSPQWQYGGENAGAGGSMETAWTDYHNVFRASVFDPDVRGALYGGTYPTSYPTDGPFAVINGRYHRSGYGPHSNLASVGHKDGMGNPTDPSSILSDQSIAPVDAWSQFGECCSPTWGPSATAEAQVLTTAQALEGYDYGNAAIQNAVNQTEDASVGYTDCQLQSMLNNGAY